jgi:cytosolic phospholipase A2
MNKNSYNPYDTDTEEQMAYQREMLTNYSRRHHKAGGDELHHETSGDRNLSGDKADDKSSDKEKRSFGDVMRDLGDTAKASFHAVKSYVSLEHRMNKDIQNPQLFPEVSYQAFVRRGLNLCQEEQAWLHARKAQARDHFAAYMGWDPAHIHPDDVPTVAFGGSGGGYRAMLAVLGYSQAMKMAGLWPLLSYISGVSGSCWAIAAYFAFGRCDMDAVIEHCKKRLSPHHPLSPEAVQQVLSLPHGDYQTLGPLIQKHASGLHNVAMDLYAVFTTGHLFAEEHDPMMHPGGTAEAEIPGRQKGWWKWTEAQQYLRNGAEPLPILTAIRHERPWKDWADSEHPFASEDPTTKEHQSAADAWFQWFEMTPYEVGCDELQAWVPTWGFGRKFEEGHSVSGLPEQSLALLLGLCTSAPAGPLSSYLSTIQRNLPHGFLGNAINGLASGVAKIWGKHETAVFENHHPLHASNEHNFMFHYTPTPKGTPRPPGLENSPRIHLVDGGMVSPRTVPCLRG